MLLVAQLQMMMLAQLDLLLAKQLVPLLAQLLHLLCPILSRHLPEKCKAPHRRLQFAGANAWVIYVKQL